MLEESKQYAQERKRKLEIIAVLLVSVLLFFVSKLEVKLYSLSELVGNNDEFLRSVIYFFSINSNIILILILSFIILRNVARLVVQRKRGVFGSKLKTRLVFSLVLFALGPTLLMFYISTQFISKSFNTWLSEKVKATIIQTREAGDRIYQRDLRRLEGLARIAATQLRADSLDITNSKISLMNNRLESFNQVYGVDLIRVFDQSFALMWTSARTINEVSQHRLDEDTISGLIISNQAVRWKPQSTSILYFTETQDVVLGIAPIKKQSTGNIIGYVVVEEYFGTQIKKNIEELNTYFSSLKPTAEIMALSYLVLLVFLSLLIMFAACWLGFFVAKAMTLPINNLANAIGEVALGNYGVNIPEDSDDEAGQLVKAFNRMTHDLQSHKEKEIQAKKDLSSINVELDSRRKAMETILQSISNCVISIDGKKRITSFNRSAETTFRQKQSSLLGKSVHTILDGSLTEPLWNPLFERLTHARTIKFESEINLSGVTRNFIISAGTILNDQGMIDGCVIVLDDAKEQVILQRLVAWREVAKRIAHEIKNPITPIKLNAERLSRRFSHNFIGDEKNTFNTCLQNITYQVDNLNSLVKEFSRFSRLPNCDLRKVDIIPVIEKTVSVFRQAYSHISFEIRSHHSSILVAIDKDQISRAIFNLISNSVHSIEPDKERGEIYVQLRVDTLISRVEVSVIDNGKGIPAKDIDRVKDPYYSTKSHGTGLGLSIVEQILTEHASRLSITTNAEKRGTTVSFSFSLQET